ncbi:hypothetical protein JCM10556A_22120 [Bacteroides acidifaciens]
MYIKMINSIKMKKIIILLNVSLFVIMLVFSSCNSDEYSYEGETSVKEKNLNLQAPSGEYIAKNIKRLKELLSPIIEEDNWENKDFEIVSIQYDSLEAGFCAEIEYVTEDGIESNIILVKKETTSGPKIKTRTEGGSEDGYESYSCKKRSNNKCKKCRVINDKEHGQVRCACDDGLVEGCALYEYKY